MGSPRSCVVETCRVLFFLSVQNKGKERLRLKMETNRGDSWITLYTQDTLLRYKSEWDPRLHAHTKGGYLDGEIRVPKVNLNETLFMTLETFPAEDVNPEVAEVHPCILHVVRMGN